MCVCVKSIRNPCVKIYGSQVHCVDEYQLRKVHSISLILLHMGSANVCVFVIRISLYICK